MREEIYGISGTNKCYREVVPLDNIAILTSYPQGVDFPSTTNFEIPPGWDWQSTMVIGASLKKGGIAGYVFGDYLSNEKLTTRIDADGIHVTVTGSQSGYEYNKYIFSIVLLNVSGVFEFDTKGGHAVMP